MLSHFILLELISAENDQAINNWKAFDDSFDKALPKVPVPPVMRMDLLLSIEV